MLSLKDLAQHLGLSPTTVSRALNGYPEVSAATRQRVEKAAASLGYHANTRARSLATGRARAIGHVIPVSENNEIVNPIFGDFLAGAGEVYGQNDYDLVMSVVSDADEVQAYRNLRARRTVDGVILHGPRLSEPRLALLHELGFPFVVHGRSGETSVPYSWVDVGNRRAFHRAAEFLLDLGHRDIGLINGFETMDFAHRRRKGFEDALSAAGVAINPAWMSSGEMTERYGHRVTRMMLRGPNPPSALLVSSVVAALGVRRAADELGLQVGRDVSIMVFDDDISYLRNDGEVPQFTAMRSSVRQAGQIAAQMLLDLIENPGQPPRHLLLEAELVLGLSTGPAGAR